MWELDYKDSWVLRINAFELWCWRRLLRVSWTARRPSESIVREISLECSLEGLMLSSNSNTLATWCEELTHWKTPWCWERLKAVGKGDNRGWDGWMASLTPWTWVWVNSKSWWWSGKPGVLQSIGLQRVRHDWVTELNWSDGKGIGNSLQYSCLESQGVKGAWQLQSMWSQKNRHDLEIKKHHHQYIHTHTYL